MEEQLELAKQLLEKLKAELGYFCDYDDLVRHSEKYALVIALSNFIEENTW